MIGGLLEIRPKNTTDKKLILRASKYVMDFWRIILEYMMNYREKMGQRGPAKAPHVLGVCHPRAYIYTHLP